MLLVGVSDIDSKTITRLTSSSLIPTWNDELNTGDQVTFVTFLFCITCAWCRKLTSSFSLVLDTSARKSFPFWVIPVSLRLNNRQQDNNNSKALSNQIQMHSRPLSLTALAWLIRRHSEKVLAQYVLPPHPPGNYIPIYAGGNRFLHMHECHSEVPNSCVSRHLVFPATDEKMESNTCSAVGHCMLEMSIWWPPAMDNLKHSWSMVSNCFFRSVKFMCLSVSQSPERIAALSCSVSSIPLKVSHGCDRVSSPFPIFLFLLGFYYSRAVVEIVTKFSHVCHVLRITLKVQDTGNFQPP